MVNYPKVLISDVETRKAHDVVNILQHCYGYECILCSSKDYKVQLPLVYGTSVMRLRSSNYPEFETDFSAIIEMYKDQLLVYVPVSEKPTRLLYQFLKIKPVPNLKYLLPREDHFNLCADKFRFQQLCEEWGFPVPKSFVKIDLPKLSKQFIPLILKPRSGQGSVGIRYINNSEELKQLESINWDEYILQEKIESNKQVAGAFFLCKKGELINAYSHQRLRTFPLEGGVTVFSQSTCVEEIIEIGSKLLRELEWNGLAMIEFLYDETSQSWKIIEINPRLWGSVLLSAYNNSGMMQDYIQLCIGEKVSNTKKNESSYIRWLFPFEFLNFLKGNIGLREFFNLERKKICYINFTYSTWYRSIAYLLYFTFNFSSVKRFIKKIT